MLIFGIALVALTGLVSSEVSASGLVDNVTYQCTNDPDHEVRFQPFIRDALEDDAKDTVDSMCRMFFAGRAYNLHYHYR